MLNKAHGGNIAAFIEKYPISQDKIIDFSANINPLGLPKRVKKTILENFNSITHYPDPVSLNLKKRLANFHNIDPANILIGNGSTELIYLTAGAFQPKTAIIPVPSFSEYEFALKLNTKTRLIFVKLQERDNFRINVNKFKKLMPQADLIFLCNPGNPAGNLFLKSDLLDLTNSCKKHNAAIVIDEAFIDFVEDAENLTLVSEAVKKNNLLVLRSLTKFFALAGLRLGYAIGHKKTISKLGSFQYPWAVNSLAQIAAEMVVSDYGYIEKSRQFMSKEKGFLWKKLKAIKGIKPYPPASNFILCKLTDKKIDSQILSNKLADQGLIIRNCGNFRGLTNEFFRLAVRKRNENIILIQALRNILKQ